MEFNMNLRSASDKLMHCVNVIMNPNADQVHRQEAYKVCEEFKESSPLCIDCGFTLAGREKSPVVRHFGLQLIEHCIKFRWNSMTQGEKIVIKNKAMDLLMTGTDSVLVEQPYIKDILSRIIVEMIKREWPQQWPALLEELDTVCSLGETQTELVLLIFLRLVEDIVIFQNFQNQRRREIYQSMTSNLQSLFSFFLCTLNTQFMKYNEQKQGAEESSNQQMLVHARVGEAVLKTLAGFVEWVPVKYIAADDCVLLSVLCTLLDVELLQMSAAECLLLVLGRKGNVEDRKPLLYLFQPESMSAIATAARCADNLQLEQHQYLFLRKLCEALVNLGFQLTAVLAVSEGVKVPPTFSVYLNRMLAFTKHPSIVLSSSSMCLWPNLCHNRPVFENHALKEILPDVLNSIREKLLKVGFPSKNDSVACEYSRLDFDSDEEFLQSYNRLKVEIIEVLRQISSLQPDVCLKIGKEWMTNLIQETGKLQNAQDSTIQTLQVQWNGVEQFFEGINRIFTSEKAKPLVEEGMKLLEALLDLTTQDPIVLSSVLSCISTFFNILSSDSTLLPRVLDKIFAVAVFSMPGQTKFCRSKIVKNVRRHACSLLIRISKQYASLILPAFGHMYNHIRTMCEDPEELTYMEKCSLYESLILLSNEFGSYQKQYEFLGEIIAPVAQMFLSEEVKRALSSVEAFISYVGLNCEPSVLDAEDVYGANRSVIMHCISFVLAVIKRATWPSDAEAASNGGYLCVGESNSGSQCYRNPATPHIVPLLGGLFSLARILNSLYVPEYRSLINPGYSTALDILENEKKMLLGQIVRAQDFADFPSNKSPLEKMQIFLANTHENCFHTLGNGAQNLGLEFYAVPELPHFIESNAFCCVDYLPDYRLRFFNRAFIKCFFQFCPPSHYNLAVAVLEIFAPFMHEKLSARWESFKENYGTRIDYDEDMAEAEEVIEDQLNRQLTREYVDTLAVVISQRKVNGTEQEEMSDLGKLILDNESLRPVIITTLFSFIYYLDTNACLKSLGLCTPVIKQMLKSCIVREEAEAWYLLQCVLLGLQEHGEHEANQGVLINLGLLIYESLRPYFPHLREALIEFTGCKRAVLNFDELLVKCHSKPNAPVSEKKRREAFKKIVSEIVGKNVGQHYKRQISIRNLPPLFMPPRAKTRSVDEVESQNLGICSLFVDKSGVDDSRTAAAVNQ